MYTVYKHTAPSGKVYIGITGKKPGKRWNYGNGYRENKHFYRAIRKYGWKNIEHEIVENGLTKQQACDLEIELIAKYDATDPRKGYNISTGGEYGSLGVRQSAESRLKRSEALKGANSPWYGKHLSSETRRKLSEARKRQTPPMMGKHHSNETRRKISESLKGNVSACRKQVMNIETGEKYASAADAAIAIGCKSADAVARVCRGERKTAVGYHWIYAE